MFLAWNTYANLATLCIISRLCKTQTGVIKLIELFAEFITRFIAFHIFVVGLKNKSMHADCHDTCRLLTFMHLPRTLNT